MTDSRNLRLAWNSLSLQRLRIAVFALIAIATIRVILTYPVFSLTADEPLHVSCGFKWLETGTYACDVEHPPLVRVMAALPPYLAGARLAGGRDMYQEGWGILNSGGASGDRNLALARLGVLPFLWLGAWVLYRVTLRYFGAELALLATAFFTLLPPVLAHAGLATTDMALTATLGLACHALLVWVSQPSMRASLGLGLALGLTVSSKLSSLAYLPAIALGMTAAYLFAARPGIQRLGRRAREYFLPAAVAAVAACIFIWAAYRFSFDGYPAPDLIAGIQELASHNQQGHLSYLLGERSQVGFWYFFPVALGVKTPLALLLLFAVGAVICWKKRAECEGRYLQPLAFAGAILAVGVASRINVGVRHVLPIYFVICLVAAIAAQSLWRSGSRPARVVCALLAAWMIASTGSVHPDYLAYFNEFAGGSPEEIIVDSDLDWGQDWKRLAQRLQAAGATEVAVDPLLVNNPAVLLGFPKLTPLDPDAPKPGWNAVSILMLKLRFGMFQESPRPHPWAESIPPTERIGKSILLWYVPGAEAKEMGPAP